jgi:hypothetical protein
MNVYGCHNLARVLNIGGRLSNRYEQELASEERQVVSGVQRIDASVERKESGLPRSLKNGPRVAYQGC